MPVRSFLFLHLSSRCLTTMRQAQRQTTQREQVQRGDSREGIHTQCWTEPGLRSVICWWGHRCLFVANQRHHELISWRRE
jgi:hypothetical protein